MRDCDLRVFAWAASAEIKMYSNHVFACIYMLCHRRKLHATRSHLFHQMSGSTNAINFTTLRPLLFILQSPRCLRDRTGTVHQSGSRRRGQAIEKGGQQTIAVQSHRAFRCLRLTRVTAQHFDPFVQWMSDDS